MVEVMKSVEEFDRTLQENDVVLADFFATWCGPCKMLSPVVEKVSEKHPEIKFVKADVDALSELASRYGIASIPTLIVFRNGEKVNQGLGFMPEARIEELFAAAK